jgi:hypothetical protein
VSRSSTLTPTDNLNHLNQQLAQLKREMQDLNAECSNELKFHEITQKELTTVKARENQLQEQKLALINEMRALRRTLEQYDSAQNNADAMQIEQTALCNLKERFTHQKNTLEEIISEKNRLTSTISRSSAKLDEIQTKIATCSENERKILSDIETIKKQIVRSQIDDLDSMISEAEGGNTEEKMDEEKQSTASDSNKKRKRDDAVDTQDASSHHQAITQPKATDDAPITHPSKKPLLSLHNETQLGNPTEKALERLHALYLSLEQEAKSIMAEPLNPKNLRCLLNKAVNTMHEIAELKDIQKSAALFNNLKHLVETLSNHGTGQMDKNSLQGRGNILVFNFYRLKSHRCETLFFNPNKDQTAHTHNVEKIQKQIKSFYDNLTCQKSGMPMLEKNCPYRMEIEQLYKTECVSIKTDEQNKTTNSVAIIRKLSFGQKSSSFLSITSQTTETRSISTPQHLIHPDRMHAILSIMLKENETAFKQALQSLAQSCQGEDTPTFRALLNTTFKTDFMADIYAEDTLLHIAARKGLTAALTTLLDFAVNAFASRYPSEFTELINRENYSKNTPINAVALAIRHTLPSDKDYKNREKCIKILYKFGANLNVRNNKGHSAQDSMRQKNPVLLKKLESKVAFNHFAIQYKQLQSGVFVRSTPATKMDAIESKQSNALKKPNSAINKEQHSSQFGMTQPKTQFQQRDVDMQAEAAKLAVRSVLEPFTTMTRQQMAVVTYAIAAYYCIPQNCTPSNSGTKSPWSVIALDFASISQQLQPGHEGAIELINQAKALPSLSQSEAFRGEAAKIIGLDRYHQNIPTSILQDLLEQHIIELSALVPSHFDATFKGLIREVNKAIEAVHAEIASALLCERDRNPHLRSFT